MFVAQKLYEGLAIGELGQTGLITYMRTDSFRISDEARVAATAYIEQDLVPGLCPVQAQRLQEQEEGPGRPRGHPPGAPRPAARKVKQYRQERGIRPLQAHLEQVHRLADGPGRRRGDRLRHPRRELSLQGQGRGPQVRGLPGRDPERERGPGHPAQGLRGRDPDPRRRRGRTRGQAELHPAARPAIPRARWSRSSRPRASAGRARTRRSSRRSRTGSMSSGKRASSSRRIWACSSRISWSRTSPSSWT